MRNSRPDVVIVAAATVGGIQANRTRPAEFLHDNLMIALGTRPNASTIKVSRRLLNVYAI